MKELRRGNSELPKES